MAAPSRSGGITDREQLPLPSSEFSVTNAWFGQGVDRTHWLALYAGVSLENGAAIPAVALYRLPADPNAPNQYTKEVGIFADPDVQGSLEIASVRGNLVSLTCLPSAQRSASSGRATSSSTCSDTEFDLHTDQFR